VHFPGIFGVFYYRSARPATLAALHEFFPVPTNGLLQEFNEQKLDAEAICARSIQGLYGLGVRHIYISNLPVADAPVRLSRLTRTSQTA
jgi:hypothetical protein